jgi:hypothetical protein
MIKTTLRDLLNARSALATIADPSNKMRAKSAYHFSKRMDAINIEYKSYEKLHNDLVTKYGSEYNDEIDGKKVSGFRVNPENMDSFNKEYNELIDTEVTLNTEPLSIEDLLDIKLNYDQITSLGNLIKD